MLKNYIFRAKSTKSCRFGEAHVVKISLSAKFEPNYIIASKVMTDRKTDMTRSTPSVLDFVQRDIGSKTVILMRQIFLGWWEGIEILIFIIC